MLNNTPLTDGAERQDRKELGAIEEGWHLGECPYYAFRRRYYKAYGIALAVEEAAIAILWFDLDMNLISQEGKAA